MNGIEKLREWMTCFRILTRESMVPSETIAMRYCYTRENVRFYIQIKYDLVAFYLGLSYFVQLIINKLQNIDIYNKITRYETIKIIHHLRLAAVQLHLRLITTKSKFPILYSSICQIILQPNNQLISEQEAKHSLTIITTMATTTASLTHGVFNHNSSYI